MDGSLWTATPALITASANTSQSSGSLHFQGSTQAAPVRAMAIHLGRINGNGTYPLGVNVGTNAGGTLTMTVGSNSWWTPLNGSAGQITVTSIGGGRIRGTFRARLERMGGTPGEDLVEITDGEFNVPVNPGYTAPAADDRGSVVTGSVGGQQWNAATIVGTGGGTSLVAIAASSDEYMVTLAFGPPEEGTSPLSSISLPVRSITVVRTHAAGGGGWGMMPGATGTVTVGSVTANRIQGSLNASLPPTSGGGSPITVNLTFDARTAQ